MTPTARWRRAAPCRRGLRGIDRGERARTDGADETARKPRDEDEGQAFPGAEGGRVFPGAWPGNPTVGLLSHGRIAGRRGAGLAALGLMGVAAVAGALGARAMFQLKPAVPCRR